MTMISYAQDLEDVVLQRAFPRGYQGFYIDVGANDPARFSVTKHFYDHGWRGINIEPVPDVFESLRAARPRDINIHAGLSDHEAALTFHEIPGEPTLSTFSPWVAAVRRSEGYAAREITIPVTTLARICEKHVHGGIDFLKIDVEGLEDAVIRGADWLRWRPRVLLVENHDAATWEPRILEAGYLPALTTELNRFYARREDRGLREALRTPPAGGDDFARLCDIQLVKVLRTHVDDSTELGAVIGPTTVKVAQRWRRLALRHPRVASIARALARRAG